MQQKHKQKSLHICCALEYIYYFDKIIFIQKHGVFENAAR